MILLGSKCLRERWDMLGGLRVFSRVSKRMFSPSGMPLVLVHGLGVSSRYMTPLACEWASKYQVYVPDLPGYGRSQKPRRVLGLIELAGSLREWMNIVRIERAAFVGNSMGCQILVELAHLDPDCIAGAAFLGPTMDGTAPGKLAHVLRLLRDQFHEPLSLFFLQAFDYLGNGPIRTVRTFFDAVEHDMLGRAPGLTAPCLVMRGEHDPIVSQKWVEELGTKLPRASLVTVPRAGHALNYNSAQVIAPLILQFWQKCGMPID